MIWRLRTSRHTARSCSTTRLALVHTGAPDAIPPAHHGTPTRHLAENPGLAGLVDPEVAASGGFGPTLIGIESQFESVGSHQDFVSLGCAANLQYGNNGVCEPSGQMPGFGAGATDLATENAGRMLSDADIAAIVAYERSLQ